MYWPEEELKVGRAYLCQTDSTRNDLALMGNHSFGFSKKYKLTGRKNIEELFSEGSSFRFSVFQVRFLEANVLKDPDMYHRVLISVPKRTFKKAVDRNLIKRRIREAYRLNQHCLPRQRTLHIGLIYISKHIESFQLIESQLVQALHRLKTKI